VTPPSAVTDDNQGWATARTLAEALPYIQRYDRETVVIKYGGHATAEDRRFPLCSSAPA
jgi:acetylglutamate kinase